MPPKKKLVVHIDVETGEIDVKNEGNDKADEVTDINADLVGKTITDVSSITTIGTHNSPGCRYVNVRGKWYKVCH